MQIKNKNMGIASLPIPAVIVAAIILLAALPAHATGADKAQVLVDQAVIAVKDFMADPDMEWLRKHLKTAKALLIVPELKKAGFVWGGSGGFGVLLAQDKDGQWSQPAFYGMGSVTFGIQAGIEKSQVIIMVRTQNGLDNLYTSSLKLGGQASIAAGPVGAGASSNIMTDLVSFARAKGAFAGMALEGSVIKVDGKRNAAYYGQEVTPIDIIVSKKVSNDGTAKLRSEIAAAAKKF
jgi:lipid-binding SYLF domain-containing protein